ncbi:MULTISPECIES: hypothetical protein [Streptomyces]|uniref:Uncharacterized protein n=3 Tax=Streptomyces rimosus TaxID=1927 RepID=L8F022_STRR1|nr:MULTISPECIES: hypothetical protein [Streptomyces]KOG73082.1 hypothetical protein ADK78_17640 [Kitasatospora aureofaciens]MYT42066.1 hypothetical protein [Streptomyces sp. SID5471]KEF04851.1 hypothetical protein DF17_21640 [Streptomyces rimosus]KEF07123.1 hypothetical protein DF18_37465 [Streptomyces rimosus]KOT38630.1 hypothetical protein ADK42_16920 [Streptomyces rimosus subsp. rimosus]
MTRYNNIFGGSFWAPVVQVQEVHGNILLPPATVTEQAEYQAFLRCTQSSRDALSAGWSARPPDSMTANVPSAVAHVDVSVMVLQNALERLALIAPHSVGLASLAVVEAVQDAADTQFALHIGNIGSLQRLWALDSSAASLQQEAVQEALRAFVLAVRHAAGLVPDEDRRT